MVRHEVHHLAQGLRLVRVRGLCELHEQRRSLVEEVDPMGQLGHILGAENESVQHTTRGRAGGNRLTWPTSAAISAKGMHLETAPLPLRVVSMQRLTCDPPALASALLYDV